MPEAGPCAAAPRLAVVGGGPAGLMAAEVARAAGLAVDLYERTGSVGRRFLIAGKGGLNLTHAEPFDDFVARYRERADAVASWLADFDAEALRGWARGLGVETFVGSSGRVFPADLKAAPLLRGWVRRLRSAGLRFHPLHRLTGIAAEPDRGYRLDLDTPAGATSVTADAVVLALGGGSWPQLGADAHWPALLHALGVAVAPLRPSNCGFDCTWSAQLMPRHAGAPVKPVALRWTDPAGRMQQRQGELVLGASGVEGSLIYAASADLREVIARDGAVTVALDLLPEKSAAAITAELARPRGGRSIGEHLRRRLRLDGARAALLFELAPRDSWNDAERLAAHLKSLPLRLLRPRPLEEAISSAGGVRLEDLDAGLMLRAHPGLFCAGEMLDWEAPTGGYLLTASFASGRRAGLAAVSWLAAQDHDQDRYAVRAPGRALPGD